MIRYFSILLTMVLFCFVSLQIGLAEVKNVGQNESPEIAIKTCNDANISIYPDATFVYGNSKIGYCFATNESVEAVKAWYKKQLPSWQVYEDNDSCAFYTGDKETNLRDLVMKTPFVILQKNSNLPVKHSLDKNMTTEIVIMVSL